MKETHVGAEKRSRSLMEIFARTESSLDGSTRESTSDFSN